MVKPGVVDRGLTRGFFAAAAPIMLILAGVACIVYAVGWHRVAVLVPQPAAAPPPAEFPPDQPPFPPSDIAPVGPEPQAARPAVVYSTENELIRETTRGGVTLTETGQIARTYSGEPPEACPT